jgi:hypothetical protein
MEIIEMDFSFTRLIFDLKIPLSGGRQTHKQTGLAA